jgi:predicted RNA binding protein YcfA (HicA-like mRNA interferase family)
MVSEQPTRKVLQALRAAGWQPGETRGSHTRWTGPNGTTFTVPDGHRQISAGVYRRLLAAMREDEAK